MIQLASDPNASRLDWRAAQPPAKDGVQPAARARNGHAWPFISQQAGKPTAEDETRKPSPEHGS
ncbi:MAG: hypothetical protein HY854_00965 [Burkholderiales bacterium]|nr:hypothetical protein [Burkholderiales bacterium]